jgi:hypothetical protein
MNKQELYLALVNLVAKFNGSYLEKQNLIRLISQFNCNHIFAVKEQSRYKKCWKCDLITKEE